MNHTPVEISPNVIAAAPEMLDRLEKIEAAGSPHGTDSFGCDCECEQCENWQAVCDLLEKIYGGGK